MQQLSQSIFFSPLCLRRALTLHQLSHFRAITSISSDDLSRWLESQEQKAHRESVEKIKRIQMNSNNSKRVLLATRNNKFSTSGQALTIPNPERKIIIADNFIDSSYLLSLCGLVTQSELKFIFSSPGERKIVVGPSSDLAEDMIGHSAVAKINHLRNEIKHFAERHWRVSHEAGAILSWLTPFPHNWTASVISNTGATYRYTDAHVDKGNNYHYDLGCLLYLSSNFSGGSFVLMNEDAEYEIEPKAGRLLLFTSSIENVHRVEEVHSGDRLLLSVWMTLLP